MFPPYQLKQKSRDKWFPRELEQLHRSFHQEHHQQGTEIILLQPAKEKLLYRPSDELQPSQDVKVEHLER